MRELEKKLFLKISIGDYVLTGGELPAAVFCDAIIRLIREFLEMNLQH